jgi:hypothetical protein
MVFTFYHGLPQVTHKLRTAISAVESGGWGLVILPGITRLWMRIPTEHWLFRRELLAHKRGIRRKNGNSTGNYLLMDEESTRGIFFCREFQALGQGIHPEELLFHQELLARER